MVPIVDFGGGGGGGKYYRKADVLAADGWNLLATKWDILF